MNSIEKEMLSVLRELKEKYGVFEIKAEFEAEGSRMEELMRLKDVTSAAGLPIILKIGGVEAVTDIYNALSIGVKGIIAPMGETPFAISKFLGIIDKMVPKDNAEDIDFAFNMETITCYNNFDHILALPKINLLHGVTVGRVDLTGSLGLDRTSVESKEVFDICRDTFIKARKKVLKTGLGGAISTSSIDFIKKLNTEKLIDKFETRKVVFPAESASYGDKAILKSIEFELKWLVSKRRFYSGIKSEDEARIAMLEKRIASGIAAD
ncbi:MAG TPA: citrate lyase beta subunit [Lentisphaeria bacterium]|nr:MAG: citrate lyase beta subunit [Lentisphaerae bacterium GWF2_38_69]HBM16423.1 citrate lyase beta subunit [Lentisphaeria bacterium]